MATAVTQHVPVEVYLHSCYEPDAEYVDGEIEERPMGEYDHSSWQLAIQRWFLQNGSAWNIRVRPELRVQVAPASYRVPDVTVLDRDRPIEQIITHAPVAVFEILSPEDTMRRVMRKLGEYAAMGIPQIWVIDPPTATYYRYHDGRLDTAAQFGEPGDKIHFALSEIEKLLD